MKFAVGYQLADQDEESFVDIVRDYREHIAEIYFPWPGMSSGRSAMGRGRGMVDWRAQTALEHDLVAFRDMGVKLDLLFNANCYGDKAVSQYLENQVGSLLEHLAQTVDGVDIVTTTSLAIARTVKHHFPDIDVRASVNMRIGRIQAMEYIKGLFDSFYVQRDFNRNLAQVKRVKAWAGRNNKGLCLLANSGCLRFCPGQTFHDNLVAHEEEIAETRNIEGWNPHVCWNLYKQRENWHALLQSTWIRPEDLHHYDGLFDVIKLATRMHQHPRMVIHAYVNRSYHGNLLDLFEPGFGQALAPAWINNTAFPDDWFARTSTCGQRCDECGYCEQVLRKVLQE